MIADDSMVIDDLEDQVNKGQDLLKKETTSPFKGSNKL